jgi:hypothetical protein
MDSDLAVGQVHKTAVEVIKILLNWRKLKQAAWVAGVGTVLNIASASRPICACI